MIDARELLQVVNHCGIISNAVKSFKDLQHNSLQYIDLIPSAAAGMSKPQDYQQYKDLVPSTASKSPVSNPKVSAMIDAIINNGEPSTPIKTLEYKDQASERCERKRKFSNDFDGSEERAKKNGGNEIPSFDGAEFSGEKAKSRETLNRMMEMLKIPEQRWGSIATDILKQDGEQVYLTPPTKELLPLKEVVDESEDVKEDGSNFNLGIDESNTSDALLADDGDETDGKLSSKTQTYSEEYPSLKVEDLTLANKFITLQHDMEENGIDHAIELCKLAEALLKTGAINYADYRKLYYSIED